MKDFNQCSVVDSVKRCTKVKKHKSSNLTVISGPDDVVHDADNSSFSAVMTPISGLPRWEQIIMFCVISEPSCHNFLNQLRYEGKI